MNLNYSILWFDDSVEYCKSVDLEPLNEKIESWGLKPSISFVNTAKEFEDQQPYDKFDLIVMDFNLDDEGVGSEFIAQVREKRIYTEVIFYSAEPSEKLWAALAENELEGVFIGNRTTVTTKIEVVAHQSLKKILDVENMRGIVMAEVGDIDHTLEEILTKGMEKVPPEGRFKIYNSFYKDVIKSAQKRVCEIEEFIKNPSVALLLKLGDSSKRWENYKRLADLEKEYFHAEIGDYQADVLKPRNFLAHGRPIAVEEGQKFLHLGKEYIFNDRVGIDLRILIGKYRERFSKINESIV